MGESKGEGGSWLYGIILMVSGGFILVTGILNSLGISVLNDYLGELAPELSVIWESTGWTHMAIGAWGIIGGIGLIKDQEWGWGISLVILTLVIITFLADVIAGLMSIMDILGWVKLAALIIAGVGIVYLLLTKEKYA